MRTLYLGAAPESSQSELADGERVVFAGPWCFAEQPAMLDYEWAFPPEPFADPDKLEAAAVQARRLIGTAAGHLGSSLNALHKVNLSPAFWDTALAPWLSTMVEIIIDRLWRLEHLIALHGKTPLRVPLLGNRWPRFPDSHAFLLHGALNVHWNHWLFGRLLEQRMPGMWKPEVLVREAAPLPAPQQEEPFVRGVAKALLAALPFPRMKGLSTRESLQLSFALMGNPNQGDRTLPLTAFADAYATSLPLGVTDEELFTLLETLLPQTLLDPLPRPWPFSVGTRVAPVASADDDRLRLRLAWHRERGGRLIHVQHGGEYGYVRTAVAYSTVEYRHHAFVSWGWLCGESSFLHASPPRHGELPDGHCRTTPLPHPQLAVLRGAHKEEEPSLLFVGTEMALLPYNLKSTRRTVQQLEYRADKARFLQNLPEPLRQCTQYRPYFDLPCTLPDAPWVFARTPGLTRCTGPLEPHILRCRLLVLDHLGTTLAQALAAGTPFVIFRNPAHQPLSEDTDDLLMLLTEARILFNHPAAAAEHCAAVWDALPDWWNAPATEKARKAFARRHALTVEGSVMPVWKQFLRTV